MLHIILPAVNDLHDRGFARRSVQGEGPVRGTAGNIDDEVGLQAVEGLAKLLKLGELDRNGLGVRRLAGQVVFGMGQERQQQDQET
jgi:hypothetical protein